MMAMCLKVGTRGGGVAVGVTVGMSVAVGGSGVDVEVGRGAVGIRVGGADVAHATSKTSNNMPNPERVMQYPFSQDAFGRSRRTEREEQLEQRFFFWCIIDSMVTRLHNWNLTSLEADSLQNEFRDRIILKWGERSVRTIGGVDVSIQGEFTRAAIVLLSYPDLTPGGGRREITRTRHRATGIVLSQRRRVSWKSRP